MLLPCRHRGETTPDGKFPCDHSAVRADFVGPEVCGRCPYHDDGPGSVPKVKRKVILTNFLSPGDVTVMSAAIYSLHKLHPNKFITDVRTSCDAVFEHNPLVTKLADSEGERIETNYTYGVNHCDKQPIHFIDGYCRGLSEALKVPITSQTNRPHLYLSEEERGWVSMVEQFSGFKGPYWLLNASWKSDYTSKKYYRKGWQDVIDHFHGRVLFVQVGAVGKGHSHHKLERVLDFVGQTQGHPTDIRGLIRLAFNAQGYLGAESFLHHVFAAFQKPAVTLLSGLFPAHWVSYPTARLLHNQGVLPCCRTGPCWKSRVERLGDGDDKDKSLCELPVWEPEDTVAKCLHLVRPSQVIDEIEKVVVNL